MKTEPAFRKYNRYKASSFHAYNFKMPDRYDSLCWMSLFKVNEWDSEIITELQPNLTSLRVLDVGCATGRLLLSLAKAGAKNLYGVDLAPKILEVAQQKLQNYSSAVELKVADAEDRLPWPDGFFDAIALTGVLHHFYRPVDALLEIHRALGDKGRLIIIEPWFIPVIRQILNIYLRFISHDGDCRFHSPKGIVKLLGSTDFKEIKKKKNIARFTFMITATKEKNLNNIKTT